MDGLFERDPNGAMIAFGDMMRKQIVMPAHLMNDGEHHGKTGRNLFAVRRTTGRARRAYPARIRGEVEGVKARGS